MSSLYANAREQFLEGQLDWQTMTVKAMLVTNAYVPNIASDKYVSDIPVGAIIARSSTLTSLAGGSGVARAANITFPAVTGLPASYVVVYQDTGSDATSQLIALIDSANGLPVTPNGGPVTIAWDTGPNHLFAL